MSELLKGYEYAEYIRACVSEIIDLKEQIQNNDLLPDDKPRIEARIAELEKQVSEDAKEFQKKADNYGYAFRHYEANIEILESEIERLSGKLKVEKRGAESLKNIIANNMMLLGIEKLKSTFFSFSFRNSSSVQVSIDAEKLPEQFKRVKTTVDPDKKAIKDALQCGELIEGCQIVENRSLQIK